MKYKKKYGQNFLYDKNMLEKISKLITPGLDDLIIEIGPGSGNLTKKLQEYNCNILCFEIDESLKDKLDLIKKDKTNIIYEDFLKVDLNEEISKYKYNNLYIIANIPYYITTPIIEKIAKSKIRIANMVLMVQDEVANRLSSTPGCKDYGYSTVLFNYFFVITKEFKVPKTCFFPIPKVDSAIIKFTQKNNELSDFDKFDSFIKKAFAFKRKNLKNNLESYDKDRIECILNKYNYSLQNRAEDIPLEVYIEIVKNI